MTLSLHPLLKFPVSTLQKFLAVTKVPCRYKSSPLIVTKVPFFVTKVPFFLYESFLFSLQKCPFLWALSLSLFLSLSLSLSLSLYIYIYIYIYISRSTQQKRIPLQPVIQCHTEPDTPHTKKQTTKHHMV